MNLPTKLAETKKSKQGAEKDEKKKAVLTTNFDATNKYHMIESINLSGYHFKVTNRQLRNFQRADSDNSSSA